MSAIDFTKPHLRGQRVIPRRGNSPPHLEKLTKVVPIKDPKTGEPLPSDQVIVGVPHRTDHRMKINEQDKDPTDI